jgi:hypothetical protein
MQYYPSDTRLTTTRSELSSSHTHILPICRHPHYHTIHTDLSTNLDKSHCLFVYKPRYHTISSLRCLTIHIHGATRLRGLSLPVHSPQQHPCPVRVQVELTYYDRFKPPNSSHPNGVDVTVTCARQLHVTEPSAQTSI